MDNRGNEMMVSSSLGGGGGGGAAPGLNFQQKGVSVKILAAQTCSNADCVFLNGITI
jgi:hypothetical protein